MKHEVVVLPIPGTNYIVVERFFQRLGVSQTSVNNITGNTILTIPGVSTADFTMKFLRQNGFDSVIKKHNKNGGKIFNCQVCRFIRVVERK